MWLGEGQGTNGVPAEKGVSAKLSPKVPGDCQPGTVSRNTTYREVDVPFRKACHQQVIPDGSGKVSPSLCRERGLSSTKDSWMVASATGCPTSLWFTRDCATI